MKKYIANILTGSRILFSLLIVFIPLSSAWFYAIYLFCGCTDMIDGTIARKTGTASSFGAKLDTVADFLFMLVCAIKILPLLCIPAWLWAWMIAIAIIKMCNIAFGFIRRKKLLSMHTLLNKITGLTLFLLPLSMSFIPPVHSIATICALATIATAQEVYYNTKNRNVF